MYRCSFDDALYRISYQNLILYSSTAPSYHPESKDGQSEPTINAEDPKNQSQINSIIDHINRLQ